MPILVYSCHFLLAWPAHFHRLAPISGIFGFFFSPPAHPAVTAHTPTDAHTHIRPETLRSKEICRATFRDFLCWFMEERFRHVTQDEANERNVKILWKAKNKTTQGLPFEEITGARLGVEQIKQTALYTQQQPEWSCQMSSAESRTEWILQMFVCLMLQDYSWIYFSPFSHFFKPDICLQKQWNMNKLINM